MSGRLTAEQVRVAIFNGSSYASYDGAQYYANGIDMQAIADELNTRAEMGYEDALILLDEMGLSEQTCEFVDDSDGEPSPPKCSVCGYDPGIYECAWYEDGTYGYERNYCPNCGARVTKSDQYL